MINEPHMHPGQVSRLFEVPELNYRIVSIEAGNSPGGAWLDDVQNPRTAFVWDGAHCLYFGGDADNEAFNHALTTLLTGTLLPDVRQRVLSILKLHVTSEDWTPVLETAFHSVQLQRRRRVLYGIQASADLLRAPDALQDGLSLRRIDSDLLAHTGLQNLDAMRAEIDSGWPSPERFLSEGIGYCVHHETDGIVAWCTAEYVSAGVCGVGIETLEAYQVHGLATAMASAFVREASARGLWVWWDSWLTNMPSVRVAEKTGFQKVCEYDAWLLMTPRD